MTKNQSLYPDDPACIKLDEFDYDLIIIGSGLSGLSAAYNIIRKNCGITVLILEGNDKIGGRLNLSDATRGYFIDDRQPHITRLISELGLKTIYRRKLDGKKKRIYYTMKGRLEMEEENQLDEINDFINRLDFTAKCINLKTSADYHEAKKLAKMNLETLIKNCITNFQAREIMKAIAYAICGVEPVSVSALWFIVMTIGAGGLKRRMKFSMGNNRRQFVANGADKILEKLLESIDYTDDIKIQTNSIVDLIEFNDVCTYVSLRNGEEYKCEYVIVAVPPPWNSKIQILPPPNKEILKNQKSYIFENATYFLSIYNQAWWLNGENNYSGEIYSSSKNNDCNLRLVYEANNNYQEPSISTNLSSPIYLAGFLNENFKKPIERINHPLNDLKKCWPVDKKKKNKQQQPSLEDEENNERIKRKESLDKFIFYKEWKWPGENEVENITEGCYPMSVIKPSSIKNHINPMLMPHERVYWACSEYAKCWPGTLDGAVESGKYGACSIIFQLRPQSLNSEELRFITPDTVAASSGGNAAVKNHRQIPLDLVSLHFFITGIVTAILIIYCKPV